MNVKNYEPKIKLLNEGRIKMTDYFFCLKLQYGLA